MKGSPELVAPMPKYHHCNPGSLSAAVGIDCRTMELTARYGWRLAHEIAHRELFVFSQADADSLREWANAQLNEVPA